MAPFLNTVSSIILSCLTWVYRLKFYSPRGTAQTTFIQRFTTAVNLFTILLKGDSKKISARTVPNVLVLWLNRKPTQWHFSLFTQQVDETKTLKVPEEVSDLFIRQIKPDRVQLHTSTGLIFTHPISLFETWTVDKRPYPLYLHTVFGAIKTRQAVFPRLVKRSIQLYRVVISPNPS